MHKITTQILNGNLRMPNIPELRKITNPATYIEIENMFSAMWHSYLSKGETTPVSLPYWAKRIGNIKTLNIVLKVLSTNGWIFVKSLPNNNWAEAYLLEDKLLQYVTKDQLDSVRIHHKFKKYQLKYEEPSTLANISKVQGKVMDIGIVAKGFTDEGNVPFQYDTSMLHKYRKEAIQLVNKGINKTIEQYPELANDEANYGAIAELIVDNYIYDNGTYTSGQNTTDPRGRNNAGYLNKIGNPVGFKIMRSMLVIPEGKRNKATFLGAYNIYLFIAEIHGFKNGTEGEKYIHGIHKYLKREFLDTDLDHLFENVWLERLYNELDAFKSKKVHFWSTPIEIDMSASVLGFLSLLLNHKPFMERCNMIGEVLKDAWEHDTITNRAQFKTIMRQVYGSMLQPGEMWREMNIDYTREEELAFQKELHHGELAVANAFKNFIIANCNPQPEMEVNVRGQKIKTFCNRFHHVGETTTKFDFYDSYSGSIRTIQHTDTIKKPNLKAFRRYFVTNIIHGLDGNVMNKTVERVLDIFDWCLSIHDALIVCPEAATFTRKVYAKQLELIHANRNKILQDFFRSIGIKASAIKQWKEEVLPLVQPLNQPLKCNGMVLK